MDLAYRKPAGGFTLVEIMVSSTILLLVVGISMGCFVSLIKQHYLIEATNNASLDLQRAVQQINRVVQSSPEMPEILNATGAVVTVGADGTASGVSVRLAPPQNHYVEVTGGTDVLDAATNTFGYKNTKTTITLSSVSPQATARPLLKTGATCPNSSITELDSAVFVTTAAPVVTSDLFLPGDTVRLPQTGYGGPISKTVKAVTSSTIEFTNALNTITAWSLPNGTLIPNSAGPRARLTVVSTTSGSFSRGDLVYYPDDRTLTRFTILARDVHLTPRIDPANSTSATEAPFIYNTATRELIVNLQCLPRGNSVAGRATVGTRMRIRIRTTPNSI